MTDNVNGRGVPECRKAGVQPMLFCVSNPAAYIGVYRYVTNNTFHRHIGRAAHWASSRTEIRS